MFKSSIKSEFGEDISILVQLDNHPWNYICECGYASNLSVKEIQNTNAIFISHTHIDHFIHFDNIIRHQIGIQRTVTICGPQGIAQQVQAKLKSYTWNLIQPNAITYEIREVLSDEQIRFWTLEPPLWILKEGPTIQSTTLFEEQNFRVEATLLDHKTPSLAYKFKENNKIKIDLQDSPFRGGKWIKELKEAFKKGAGEQLIYIEEQPYTAATLFHLLNVQEGDSLGIIMDHAATPSNHAKIVALFSKCRRVFIESFYKEADKDFAQANFHSYSIMSGKVMQEAAVQEAVPVHFSRKYTPHEIKELIQEFEQALEIKN